MEMQSSISVFASLLRRNIFVLPLMASVSLSSDLNAQDLAGSFGSLNPDAVRIAALEAFGEDFVSGDEGYYDDSLLDYLSVRVDVRGEFTDNVFLTNTNPEDDFIYRVSLPIELSNTPRSEHRWNLRYAPRLNFYQNNSDQDGVDQVFSAGYQTQLPKTGIDFNMSLTDVTGPSRFAAGNVEKKAYRAMLGLSHILTGKSRLDLDLGAIGDQFEDPRLFDRNRYNARLAWQYQLTGKTQLGPFIGYEHVDIEENPNHKAISGGLKATYEAFQKTTLNGYVGVENRRFEGGDHNDKVSPTFEIGAIHQYSAKTSFTGTLYHNIRASYSDAGYSYAATGLNVFARYAYSQRINFRTGFIYEVDDYFGVEPNSGQDFDASYFRVFLDGDYQMQNGLRVGAGVRYAVNNSDTNDRDYDNFIFNINLGYGF